jgi:hypothetical protein
MTVYKGEGWKQIGFRNIMISCFVRITTDAQSKKLSNSKEQMYLYIEIHVMMLLNSGEWVMSADSEMEGSKGGLVLGNILSTNVYITMRNL